MFNVRVIYLVIYCNISTNFILILFGLARNDSSVYAEWRSFACDNRVGKYLFVALLKSRKMNCFVSKRRN